MNKKILTEILKINKPINMANFINNCLYGKYGYYKNSNILGKKGDFVTSPEITQLFGEIIGLYILNNWLKKKFNKFNLIELGPGNGTLMIDLLNIALLKPESIVNKEIKRNNKINIKIIMYLQALLSISYLFLRD